jgi:hypothetical protein
MRRKIPGKVLLQVLEQREGLGMLPSGYFADRLQMAIICFRKADKF